MNLDRIAELFIATLPATLTALAALVKSISNGRAIVKVPQQTADKVSNGVSDKLASAIVPAITKEVSDVHSKLLTNASIQELVAALITRERLHDARNQLQIDAWKAELATMKKEKPTQ